MKKVRQTVTCILIGMLSTQANAQNVGISEANPLQRLDVAGGIRIGNTSNALAGSIRWTGTDFEVHDGASWKSLVTSVAAETDPTWSGAANLTSAIGRTGNVGIGTTSPGAKLEVDGSVRITGGASDVFNDVGQLALKRSSSDAPFMSFHAANGTRQAFIQSTGTHFNIRNQQDGIMRFYTNDTEWFRINANGTVRALQLSGSGTSPVLASSNGTLSRGTINRLSWTWTGSTAEVIGGAIPGTLRPSNGWMCFIDWVEGQYGGVAEKCRVYVSSDRWYYTKRGDNSSYRCGYSCFRYE